MAGCREVSMAKLTLGIQLPIFYELWFLYKKNKYYIGVLINVGTWTLRH